MERQWPNGWKARPFSHIADSIVERIDDPPTSGLEYYVGLEHLDPDSHHIQRWGSPSDVTATKLRFYPGDVIYARRRAYQRKLGVAEWDGVCSAHALVLRANPKVCLPDFLPYFLQSQQFHERALAISVGSLSPTINWRTLAKEAFVLPSIPEQMDIVEILQGFARPRYELTSCLEKTRLLREAILGEVPNANVQFSSLGELAYVVSGESWSSTSESKDMVAGAAPVVGISHLKPDGSIGYSDPTFVKGLGDNPSTFLVDQQTLLVIRTNGNANRIGNVYRSSPVIEGCALSAFIFGCRFRHDEQCELAFEYMRGRTFQSWATSLVAGTTGLKNLPIRELRRAAVPKIDTGPARKALEELIALRRLEETVRNDLSHLAAASGAARERLLGGSSFV